MIIMEIRSKKSEKLDNIIKLIVSIIGFAFAFWLIMCIYGETIHEHRATTKIMLDWIFFIDMSACVLLALFMLIVKLIHMK